MRIAVTKIHKISIILTIACVVVLGATGIVLADSGPHAQMVSDPTTCAACHRTNSTTGSPALLAADVYTLCMSCHDGTGANTNVAEGVYSSGGDDATGDANIGAAHTPDGAALLGGGFVSYKGKPVTSAHNSMGNVAEAWGNGTARGERASLAQAVTCTSCHNPHGSGNYRMLRERINGHPVSVAQVDEGAAKDFDTEQWGRRHRQPVRGLPRNLQRDLGGGGQ